MTYVTFSNIKNPRGIRLYTHFTSVSPKGSFIPPSKHKELLDTLPKEFNRKKAIDLAKKIGISERSADGYLKKVTDESLIKKLNHGMYKK